MSDLPINLKTKLNQKHKFAYVLKLNNLYVEYLQEQNTNTTYLS